jgi:hypothetical protein
MMSVRVSVSERSAALNEAALNDLNHTLQLLASLFPHIMPVVFREMLIRFEGESSLYLVTDQLLNYPDKWVQARWNISVQQTGFLQQDHELCVPIEEQFRRSDYKKAARIALYQEFRSVRQSTIDMVTAEKNYSYTRARPILQGIGAQSWRQRFKLFFSKRTRPAKDKLEEHYMLEWFISLDALDHLKPRLKKTGNFELDHELNKNVLGPLLEREKARQVWSDWALAMKTNTEEARNANALYECECCFHDASFEQIAICTSIGHITCHGCLSRAVSEALYGQNWWAIVDFERGLIKCLASSSGPGCSGFIPHNTTQRAIIQGLGINQWRLLELNIAKEALANSHISLIRCPFCSYAEINDPPVTIEISRFRLKTSHAIQSILLCLLAFIVLPILEVMVLCCRIFKQRTAPHITRIIFTSVFNLYISKHLPRRFLCRSPLCALPSCISCCKIWCDPHICYESAALSLRTTIESARTGALKRTCPQCALGFIKESGCNKLTCRCGYTMCYICRQTLGRFSGGEAYNHFCQHFRPAGGKCRECTRCDMYQVDDEETLVNKAGENAEREWRKREGMDGVKGIGGDKSVPVQLFEQQALQRWIDWWVRKLIAC